MAVPLLGVIGWAIIPRQATKQALKLLDYVLLTFFGIRPPPPGSFEHQRNYRYTFSVVVLGYLIYTLIQGSSSMQPNYYEILGVTPTADENTLKLAFRQFAKRFHPDRVGPQGEALFIRVRDAFEALKNPTTRFAYDRFGPDAMGWTQCSTIGEFLHHGLIQSVGYHVVAVAVLVFWTAIGDTSPVAFWRYLLYFSLFAFELAFLLSPSTSLTPSGLLLGSIKAPGDHPTHRTILHVLYPQRVAYQHILLLHQLFLFMSIALTRVAPQFFPDEAKLTQGMSHRLLQLVTAADREVSQILHTELHALQPSAEHVPFSRLRPITAPSEEVMDALTSEMENMIIETTVKQDGGPFKSVWNAAVQKGKQHAAAAAATAFPTTPTPKKTFEFPFSPASSSPSKALLNGSPTKHAALLTSPALNGVRPNGSGRMSPPPVPTDRPHYVRARSISLL
ncbi:DnaJ-domain-containing protein [Mycena pura]|uniref:DnaJ-domain-containing protein n=1 Tax=Mycena pura TaxID=153505 RepID=A0AAD6UZX0_9AGAR|nr:DnaJ-domain-containing protein [Mycena pura]